MADVAAHLDREVATDGSGQRRLQRGVVTGGRGALLRTVCRERNGEEEGLREQNLAVLSCEGTCGLVSPSIILPTLTAFVPSHTMQVTGPDIMYASSDGKKGFSTRSA